MPKAREATDNVRWIDTDVMIADSLTKLMDCKKLDEALATCHWDLRQPIESLEKKGRKQQQRRSTTSDRVAEEEDRTITSGDATASGYGQLAT